jgi:hypothetical protein
MRAILEIELRDDNTHQAVRRMNAFLANNEFYGDSKPCGWAAEITGPDQKYKLARSFLRFKKDYSRANSKGSRGVYAIYTLEENKIYEVKDNKRRYFCKLEGWAIKEITENEVMEWLKSLSA